MPNTSTAAAKTSLTRALAQHAEPADISSALVDWLHTGSPLGRLQFDQQPPLGKALWTLNALSVDLLADGTVHFLRSMGTEARRLADYARMIGASVTEEYATAMVAELKRLNGRRLPPETQGSMGELMDRLEDRDMRAGGTGLFESLDERYVAAVAAEIDAVLPVFAREHVDDIVREFAQHERPAARVVPPDAAGATGRRYFSSDPAAYDRRAREWAVRAGALPESAFATIAKRFKKAAARSADRTVFRVWTDGPRVGRTEEEWKAARRETAQVFIAAETRVQATLAASSLSKPARQKATEAFFYAARMLYHLPELERLPGGPPAIETQLAPFEGSVPQWNAAW